MKLDEVTDETPEERAAEIEREFDAMMADHDKVQARVDREERLAKSASKLKHQSQVVPQAEGRSAPAVDQGNDMSYRAAFCEMIANGGEAYVSPEARQVLMEKRASRRD